MLDEKDLQATAQLVDTRLDTAVKQHENKIEQSTRDTESRMLTAIQESASDTESRILACIEADVMPKFGILADGHQVLRETLAPKDRAEALEDEAAFMKQVVKALARDVNELKKAQ